MFTGRKGWTYVVGMWLFAAVLPWAVAQRVMEDLAAERLATWAAFAAGALFGVVFQLRLHGRRFRDPDVEFSVETRSRHARNAAVGTGIGISVAAILGSFDSAWLFVVLGGAFTGGCPVWATMSAYLMVKRGHTL